MLSIPPELLSTLQSPPVQASDLCTSTKVTTPKTAPEAEKETLLEMLPSTPPPPPSSGSFSVLTVSGGRSSAKKSPRPSNTIHKSVQGDTLLPVKHAACSGLTQSQTPERSKQVAQQEAHTTPSELPVVDSHRTSAAVQKEILRAPVAYSTVKAAPNGAETSGSFARGVSHAVHTSTSTPAKKKRKAEPLPRYPLDSPDDSNERLAAPSNRQEGDSAHQPELTPRQNGLLKKLVPTAPSIDHSQSKATMLVDVGFIRNVKSSPQTVAKGDDTMRVDMPALGIRTFYSGSAVQSYMLDGHPMHSAARTDHLPECLDSRSAKSANVLFDDQDSHGTKSATSVSGESSDGFEFVSFAQGNDDGALKRVKVEDTAMSLLSAFEGERTTLPDLPDFLHMQTARTGSVLAVPNNASKLASRLQLKNVSQQDLDALMSRLHTSTRKNSSTTSFDSESAEVIPTSKGSSMMANLVPLRQSSTLLTNGSLESGQAATRAQIPLITNNPSSTSSAQGGPASSRFRMTASLGARKSTIPRPPSRSISDSGRFGQRSEARKAISEITADIERYLERKGLSRRQSIDLW